MIRILVAEDFELIREDLCDVLNQQEDMTVVGSAASGKEIEALALETDFDLVLMDIEMETTTAGIQATEHILEKKHGRYYEMVRIDNSPTLGAAIAGLAI